MRERRRGRGLRELRLTTPDVRAAVVKARLADQVANLNRADEIEALTWIEAVEEFGACEP